MEERELLLERLELAILRIREIPGEDFRGAELLPWKEYFTTVAKFLQLIEDTRQFLEQGKQATATLEELQQRNHALYEDILPENYENSFANPAYAVKMLGEEFGALAAFLYTEMRSLIGFTYEGRLEELVIRMKTRRIISCLPMNPSRKAFTGSSVIMRMWRQKQEYGKWYVRRIILLLRYSGQQILQTCVIFMLMGNMWERMNLKWQNL